MINETGRTVSSAVDARIQRDVESVQRIVDKMSSEWQRAISGALAVPAAIALGFAAAALYTGLFVEVGLQAMLHASRQIELASDGVRRPDRDLVSPAGREADREQARA